MTKQEKRAADACESYREWGGGRFSVEWVKSRTWGHCPRIMWRDQKAAYASGCGYDKISAVLAEYLQSLVPEAELLRTAGAGLRAVELLLAEHGWKLEQTHNGRTEDGFKLTKMDGGA